MEKPGRSEHCECGLDEAGRGPVIGPMVVAMLCATNTAMKEIGARDSKTLSPASRESIFQRIRESAPQYSFKIIGAQEINRKMETMTLNQIQSRHKSVSASLFQNPARLWLLWMQRTPRE